MFVNCYHSGGCLFRSFLPDCSGLTILSDSLRSLALGSASGKVCRYFSKPLGTGVGVEYLLLMSNIYYILSVYFNSNSTKKVLRCTYLVIFPISFVVNYDLTPLRDAFNYVMSRPSRLKARLNTLSLALSWALWCICCTQVMLCIEPRLKSVWDTMECERDGFSDVFDGARETHWESVSHLILSIIP